MKKVFKNERAFGKALMASFKQSKHYNVVDFQEALCDGVPDFALEHKGSLIWLELKILHDDKPAKVGLRRSQVDFLHSTLSRAKVICSIRNDVYIWNKSKAEDLFSKKYNEVEPEFHANGLDAASSYLIDLCSKTSGLV